MPHHAAGDSLSWSRQVVCGASTRHGARQRRQHPNCPRPRGGVIIAAQTMKLRLRLVLLLMLPLLLVIGVYSILRVQQESRARVEDARHRADGMARTIQIAVESVLDVRGRPQSELVDLLNDMTQGQRAIDQIRIFERGGLLAASEGRAAAHPASPETVARVIESGAAEIVETHGSAGEWWIYVLPVPSAPPNGPAPASVTPRAIEVAFVAPDTGKMARRAIRDVFVRVGSLTVVLALLIAVVLQRQVLRPLANLAGSIRALGEGRRGPPLPGGASGRAGRAGRVLQPHGGAARGGAPASGGRGRVRAGPRAAAPPIGDAGRGRQARFRHRARGRHAAQHHLRPRGDRPAQSLSPDAPRPPGPRAHHPPDRPRVEHRALPPRHGARRQARDPARAGRGARSAGSCRSSSTSCASARSP